MPDQIANRRFMLQALKAELIGPAPAGEEIDCSAALHFSSPAEARGPYRQKGSGEEILIRSRPGERYGAGVLYPIGTVLDSQEQEGEAVATSEPLVSDEAAGDLERIRERKSRRGDEEANDELDLSSANALQPGSMGLSLLVRLMPGTRLVVKVTGGRYHEKKVTVQGEADTATFPWWLREPVTVQAVFRAEDLQMSETKMVNPSEVIATGVDNLQLRVQIFTRPHDGDPGQRLLTIVLVNRTVHGLSKDARCLFQAEFSVTVLQDSDNAQNPTVSAILPYPDRQMYSPDPEERGLALLYRSRPTFAVGHGCAADWPVDDDADCRTTVTATPFPTVEIPTITSEIVRADGTPLEVPMALPGGLIAGQDGFTELQEVIDRYRDWIEQRETEVATIPFPLQSMAAEHLSKCRRCADRMQEGLEYLKHPDQKDRALRAFRLANRAILLQQIAGGIERRAIRYDEEAMRFVFEVPYQGPEMRPLPEQQARKWRAFQIAFLLMSLRSVAENTDLDRDTVELIWFPTGGGKTEAYLGLAAFAMFLRRIDRAEDTGVNVLMRYTLRLLTAQQFQRASGLICAMEYLRRQPDNTDLGTHSFSIGIWVGGDTTPNSGKKAQAALTILERDPREENPFLLTRCPWCGATIGPLRTEFTGPRRARGAGRTRNAQPVPKVVGYHRTGDSVSLNCSDPECRFARALPVYVIDEAIYQNRPTLVIGTVDKFAQLAWRPGARTLFGINVESGVRELSPPGLIIQDELHLISGPLGSMVGLYETLIEELCTDRRTDSVIRPKIICSTATIRRFHDQVRALYARMRTELFPPPGLDAGDSFFAVYARDHQREGRPLLPGKIYAGVNAPGHGSLLTTQTRVNAALLQAAADLPGDEADPWWTLLIFFNSLRELGGALTLMDADIPERLEQLCFRTGKDFREARRLSNFKELTSRLRNDEVPEAIDQLKVPYRGRPREAVDVVLASNIIEVGVDIDRLSLMSVVGQPKTTSQYIQVTGRVGRRTKERPGLVVTLYGPGKPRDRSHFEKFRTYHEHLYAQVEPTSVTPFSPPLMDRALHAVLVASVRQTGAEQDIERPDICPQALIESFRTVLLPRIKAVDSAEEANVLAVLSRREQEWLRWHRASWQANDEGSGDPLLRPAGEYTSAEQKDLSWATPTSLRNVDSECQAQITNLYL